jgi:hypothetical protein
MYWDSFLGEAQARPAPQTPLAADAPGNEPAPAPQGMLEGTVSIFGLEVDKKLILALVVLVVAYFYFNSQAPKKRGRK